MKPLHIVIMPLALTGLFFSSCQRTKPETTTEQATLNKLSEKEQAEGWQLLFDGQTLKGWKRFNHDTIGPLWSVDDGMIICNGEGHREGTPDIGGSLITTRDFGNFDLIIDWKISPGGNSGILYHVVEKPEFKYDYETGPEYQLLDDAAVETDINETQKAASNYDMYAASASKKLNPAGAWNTSRIVYNEGHVEHWLNGERVLTFDEASEDFQERYKKSKWVDYPHWNKARRGAISLQDHGAPVYFRNIKIKEL